MPNCDFYASLEDHEPLLDWLFSEARCEVFQAYSGLDQPLAMLRSSHDVLKLFDGRYTNGRLFDSVDLVLYVVGSGPTPVIRRIALNPSSCGGATYRFTVEGWGLILVTLQTVSGAGLKCSHTNHNSKARAEKWEDVSDRLGTPSEWDFEIVTAYSGRINREIRKRAVEKIGSRVVLPGAHRLRNGGVRFLTA